MFDVYNSINNGLEEGGGGGGEISFVHTERTTEELPFFLICKIKAAVDIVSTKSMMDLRSSSGFIQTSVDKLIMNILFYAKAGNRKQRIHPWGRQAN